MKIWQTTTKNKCFVKMLWHLLGEYVKTIVLLVCSICTFFFFFNHRFVLFVLIYKSANGCAVLLHCTSSVFALYIYSAILLSHFVFFYLFIFKVLNSCYNTTLHRSYISYFFFFGLPFVLLFSFIYIVILTEQISQFWGVNFL